MSGPQRRSLADLAAESGAPVPCSGNLPLDMGDPRYAWFVESGPVDVFLVERRDGEELSAPQHLLRAESGHVLPGVAPQAGKTTLSLIAKGLPGTMLRRLPAASLAALPNEELAARIDRWIAGVSAALVRDVAYWPLPDALIEPGQDPSAATGTLAARRGAVWVSVSPPSDALYLGLIEFSGSGPDDGGASGAIPLTSATWITLTQSSRLSAHSSESLAGEGLLLSALANFHQVALSLERINRSLAVVDQANLERARATSRRADEEDARRRLFNLYDLPETGDDGEAGSALREVLRTIGRHEGIRFTWPARTEPSASPPALGDILDASGVRGRRVRLSGENRWWIGDSGAMLGFRADGGGPVALLPGPLGRYRAVEPFTRRKTGITAGSAETLQADAWVFYRPLKSAGGRLRDLLRLGGRGLGGGVARFTAAGLLGGLVLLLPAVILGFIANRAIPAGDTGLLYSATAVLAAFALIGALLHMFQGMALMRLEGRAASRIEAAFWDRLLRLPPAFLRRYSAGDRAMRGTTFQRVRDAMQGVVANDVLSIVFVVPALAVIFLYDAALGGATAAFGLLSLVATVALGMRQVSPHARAVGAMRRTNGRLFQLINGISRLRVGGAEGSAFAVWAREYREQKRAESEFSAWDAHLRAFGAALPLLAGAVVLLAASLRGPETLAAGDFLVIYFAFMTFVTGVIRLGASFSTVAGMAPELRQVEPFLAALPETTADGEPVEHLGGDIVFDRVSFRYSPDGPLILDDVSIRARPGEFVAITGGSGTGKSTLFRLALGLIKPTAGSVYYDGRDLGKLNVKQVRRKIGAVPQEINLHPQDLWDNIVGDRDDATVDAVRQAVMAAAVGDEIAAMPMGMLTAVGDSGSVTSGGESQRIMIARALLKNPRLMLLDEATNWLDNDSQSRVMDSLAQLTSTRIVIAHRLSTLREADRIYVLQSGKVVQEGAFWELSETEGVFQDLVRRQMA